MLLPLPSASASTELRAGETGTPTPGPARDLGTAVPIATMTRRWDRERSSERVERDPEWLDEPAEQKTEGIQKRTSRNSWSL